MIHTDGTPTIANGAGDHVETCAHADGPNEGFVCTCKHVENGKRIDSDLTWASLTTLATLREVIAEEYPASHTFTTKDVCELIATIERNVRANV